MTDHDLDLTITKISKRQANAGGVWVSGTIDGRVRFEALVFADHAECESYELERSKISKLWLQRISDRKILFNFDRGDDVKADSTYTLEIIGFLCEGLSDLVFGQ